MLERKLLLSLSVFQQKNIWNVRQKFLVGAFKIWKLVSENNLFKFRTCLGVQKVSQPFSLNLRLVSTVKPKNFPRDSSLLMTQLESDINKVSQ